MKKNKFQNLKININQAYSNDTPLNINSNNNNYISNTNNNINSNKLLNV